MRVGCGIADAVDEQVCSVAEGGEQFGGVVALGGHESPPVCGDVGRQVGGVTPGEADAPSGREQAAGRGAADRAGTADDECARHRPTVPTPRPDEVVALARINRDHRYRCSRDAAYPVERDRADTEANVNTVPRRT